MWQHLTDDAYNEFLLSFNLFKTKNIKRYKNTLYYLSNNIEGNYIEVVTGIVVNEKILTHNKQYAKTDFVVTLNGKNASCHVTSRSVATDESYQEFTSNIVGNNKSFAHVECDAIIQDKASVKAIPEIYANDIDANLIHEAAIGKIAGAQLMKLMSLGLSEKEAEETIINGFLK